MAVELIATVGNASANSYETLAEADSYAELYWSETDRQAWLALVADERRRLLIRATRQMELVLAWEGERADETQALSWPRELVYDRDGYAVLPTVIPQPVKDAQSEVALWLAQTANTGVEETSAQLDAVKIGPITVDLNQSSLGAVKKFLPDRAMVLLTGLAVLDPGEVQTGGMRSVRLVRS